MNKQLFCTFCKLILKYGNGLFVLCFNIYKVDMHSNFFYWISGNKLTFFSAFREIKYKQTSPINMFLSNLGMCTRKCLQIKSETLRDVQIIYAGSFWALPKENSLYGTRFENISAP